VFLASDEAKWITGTVLTVDGGSSMVSRHVYSDDVMGVYDGVSDVRPSSSDVYQPE